MANYGRHRCVCVCACKSHEPPQSIRSPHKPRPTDWTDKKRLLCAGAEQMSLAMCTHGLPSSQPFDPSGSLSVRAVSDERIQNGGRGKSVVGRCELPNAPSGPMCMSGCTSVGVCVRGQTLRIFGDDDSSDSPESGPDYRVAWTLKPM